MSKLKSALVVSAFSLLMAYLAEPVEQPQAIAGWLYLVSMGAALGLLAAWMWLCVLEVVRCRR